MVDSCTRFIKGVVIKNKEGNTVIDAIHKDWICNVGYPSVGFWADNGKEFSNYDLMGFTTKNNISIKLGPAHSPWSNGCNERNHYSADKIVDKIMESDKKVKLEEAVSIAGWTHNTNSNRSGFSPMQLVTGKSVIIPGITYSNPVNHGETNSEIVQ